MNNHLIMNIKKSLSEASGGDRIRLVGIGLFVALLLVVGLLGLIIPLRPKTSDVEKRTLTTFPIPSLTTLANGEFFSGVDTWYADTFPLREQLISANAELNSLYGLAGEEIHGNISTGDTIPSTPLTSDVFATLTDDENLPAESSTSASETPSTEGAEAPNVTVSEEDSSGSVTSPYDQLDPEINGAIYIAGNSAYNLYYFNLDKANRYIQTISRAAGMLKDQAQVYSILVPTSTGVMLSAQQQEELGCSSSEDAISYMYGSMSSLVNTVPVYEALMQHRDEYIYFRTDHHWTALGAYYAYDAYSTIAGLTPCKLTELSVMEFPGFLGTYYASSNQSPALSETPDTVYAYVPAATNQLTFYDAALTPTTWPIINDVSNYQASNKYSCFIGGDNAYTEIVNPSITDGSACLLYKDSYGNPFATFLVSNYQTVYIIDYRYFTVDLKEFVQSHHVQDVIFLNNLEAVTDSTIARLQTQLQ